MTAIDFLICACAATTDRVRLHEPANGSGSSTTPALLTLVELISLTCAADASAVQRAF
jgi:hypothetical protein